MADEIQIKKSTPNQSPANSQGSSTHPPPPPLPQKEERVEEEEITAMDNKKNTSGSKLPQEKPNVPDSLQCFTAEEVAKYKNYEAEYASYLRAKYFSGKDVYGGDIFDLSVSVGDEPIRASRWSPTRSYADPKQSFTNLSSSGEAMPSASASASVTGSSPNVPNGSAAPQKKSS